jgi:hypothetical protein
MDLIFRKVDSFPLREFKGKCVLLKYDLRGSLSNHAASLEWRRNRWRGENGLQINFGG